jgi:hypothetical protein
VKAIAERKGAAHVVEAILAAGILIFFVLSITTLSSPDAGQETALIQQQTQNVLKSLDRNGTLRQAAVQRDLGTLRAAVTQYIPDRQVAIAVYGLNTTSHDISFTGQHTTTFAVTDTIERQRLRIWYRNTTAANISIDGQFIANHTGRRVDQYDTYRIDGATSIGDNTLQIDATGSADIGYSIDQHTRHQTGEPPADRTVFTTSYMVSGRNTTFAPTEVTVISWY